MNVPERILCVTHTFDGPAAQIALIDGRLKYLGGSPGTEMTVNSIIDDIERDGSKVPEHRSGKRPRDHRHWPDGQRFPGWHRVDDRSLEEGIHKRHF